jgi:hypothetical protein
MNRYLFLLFLLALWGGMGCQAEPTAVLIDPGPTAVPITNGREEIVSWQDGPLWVLISGVDEHGLMAEPNIYLLSRGDVLAFTNEHVHTGIAAAVLEIRQDGLRRFYHVLATDGQSGWVSDYNVRRVAYLYDGRRTEVTLYDAPKGNPVATLTNVYPVHLLNPTAAEWWEVTTLDGATRGWIQAEYVKESSEKEFLINGGVLSADHDH